MFTISFVPSVLWRCWLGGRKGIRPEKKLVVSAGMVICLERGADLHMAQPMPPPLTVSCFSIIHIGFTFLVPAHPGSPGQMAVKHVCVCVCVCVWLCVCLLYHLLHRSSSAAICRWTKIIKAKFNVTYKMAKQFTDMRPLPCLRYAEHCLCLPAVEYRRWPTLYLYQYQTGECC